MRRGATGRTVRNSATTALAELWIDAVIVNVTTIITGRIIDASFDAAIAPVVVAILVVVGFIRVAVAISNPRDCRRVTIL